MRTDELDFDLPSALIATKPCAPREAARLLVVHRQSDRIEHRHIADLPDLLSPGDHMIVNETAVVPARLCGVRVGTDIREAGLFLEERADGQWRVLLERSRKLRPGMQIRLEPSEPHDRCAGSAPVILTLNGRDDEAWLVSASPSGGAGELLRRAGCTPLPPYILRARSERGEAVSESDDRSWYQTAFAQETAARSVAAPTAGLHLTPSLLARCAERGIGRSAVTLDVGAGTFRPVTAERLEDHVMHRERFAVPPQTLKVLHERARTGKPRLVAVGTTTVRTLESLPDPLPVPGDGCAGETNLLIMPPYRMRHVDALLTNFHLPRSTLLALVAAMVGLPRLLEIYREAIAMEYRFFSYGDAMLVISDTSSRWSGRLER